MDTIHTASFDAEKVMVLEFRSISIRFKNSSKRSRSWYAALSNTLEKETEKTETWPFFLI